MAKTLTSTLFICCFLLLQYAVGATNYPIPDLATPLDANTCNAPAPTNFRITSASSNFISLAWNPAWWGATHTLAVLESDGQGGWIGVDTLHNVPDSAYTVDNLIAGQTYRFYLATNCNQGNPSQLRTKIDGITLILDLTILGRTPMTPTAPTACEEIPLNVHWRGFQVSYSEEEEFIENQFEIEFGGSSANSGYGPTHFSVKRVGLFNPIVAAKNPTLDSPDCNESKLSAETKFQIIRLINGGPMNDIVGIVNLALLSDPPRLKICPDFNNTDFPWKNNYVLTGLIAGRSGDPEQCMERSWTNVETRVAFNLQNPFQDQLKIIFNPLSLHNEIVRVRMINSSGQTVLEREYAATDGSILLSTAQLSPGLYFLQIELGNHRTVHKVIKSE